MSGYKEPFISRSSHSNGINYNGIVILRFMKVYKYFLILLLMLILTPFIVQYFISNVSLNLIGRCHSTLYRIQTN